MVILGIDASLNSTGYAVLKDGVLIAYGKIVPKKKKLSTIAITITEIIEKHKPDLVRMEDGFIGKNKKTALVLAKVRGIIEMLVESKNIPINLYEPTTIKRQIGGSGKATKEQVYIRLAATFKMDKLFKTIGTYSEKHNKDKTDDIYDAIAIALTNNEE